MPRTRTKNRPKNVFISYSHKDETWKDRLLPHLKALEQAGVDMVVWEDRQIDAGAQWHPEIEQAMGGAAVSVLLISADYLASNFCIKEEVPFLLNRQEQAGMLLIPVLVRKCPWKAHRWLADRQMLPRDGRCIAIDFPGDLADAVFADVAELVFDHFTRLATRTETKTSLPKAVRRLVTTRERVAPTEIEPASVLRWPALPPKRIDLTRLPETGAALFGRDEELKLLDQAWSSGEKPGTSQTRVLAFVAYGGVGKSTLVNHWLDEMQRDHFRGATRVFGWSFYSQGAREEGMASADTFISAALHSFHDPDPTSGSPWDKGERLAHLVGQERALLVLDGMEPLQSGQTFDKGKLRDPALESLLRGLARESHGLCLITTREPLADLAGRAGFASRDLEQISPEAGRALLRTTRVVGTDAELEALARRFGPHALAVSLLGVYLHERDPKHGIALAKALAKMPGKNPIDRVLVGFEQWFGDSPELQVLRLLGLFDRPADTGCLRALRAKPPIPNLTERVVKLGKADWERVLGRLERLRLIHVRHKDSHKPVVDAHPLLREHFAKQLREKNLDAWRAAHRRLYEHLCATTKEGDQPTLEDLQPLYQAVAHGCQAGLQQEALHRVFQQRIDRGGEAYPISKLGAFGSHLGAIVYFYEQPWSRASSSFNEGDRAFVLQGASFCLGALGRLREATEPIRAATQWAANKNDWEHAAVGSSNLSELELTLGEVAGAVGDAEQSVAYADRSGDAGQRVMNRTTHADALHQAGRRPGALTLFREAEQMQAEDTPEYPLLYSLRGFRYCDLLLATSEHAAWQVTQKLQVTSDKPELLKACRAISQRAAQTLKWVTTQNWLLDIALDHLTLGRAALYKTILFATGYPLKTENVKLNTPVDSAVDWLRRAGVNNYVVRGLLTRTWLRYLTGACTGPESAQADLDEAWEIAERGSMKLHMADVHLHRARLFGSLKWEVGGIRGSRRRRTWRRRGGSLRSAGITGGMKSSPMLKKPSGLPRNRKTDFEGDTYGHEIYLDRRECGRDTEGLRAAHSRCGGGAGGGGTARPRARETRLRDHGLRG